LRLHPAAHRAIEIEQPGERTDKRGQFVLPVNAPAPKNRLARRSNQFGKLPRHEWST